MDGYLDGVNTFTYPDVQAFQPMRKLMISNEGQTRVVKPRLVVNGKRNWYDIESIRAEVFDGTTTLKERALAVWKFMRDNLSVFTDTVCATIRALSALPLHRAF